MDVKNFITTKYLGIKRRFKRRFKTKKDGLFFRYFYHPVMDEVKVILNDFSGYPLCREKRVYNIVFSCGLGSLLENMMKFKAGIKFEVILIINEGTQKKENIYNSLKNKYPFIKKLFFRDNRGMDFGAYNKGYQYLRETGYYGDVVFMNSSARGPYNDYWLLKYGYLFHKRKDIGLCGVSLNSHMTHMKERLFKPHVQSFFMYTSMGVLNGVFNGLLSASGYTSKQEVITHGEIEFSTKILENNYGICSALHENFIYYKGKKWKIPEGDLRCNPFYQQLANKI